MFLAGTTNVLLFTGLNIFYDKDYKNYTPQLLM